MADRNLPDRSVPLGSVARPNGGAPAQPAGGPTPPVPAFAPGQLSFTTSGGRQMRWDGLSDPVRQKLTGWAGDTLEWWAAEGEGGRTSAVLLGTRALCTADPRTTDTGRQSHLVRRLPLDPDSFAHLDVQHPSPGADRAGSADPERSNRLPLRFRRGPEPDTDPRAQLEAAPGTLAPLPAAVQWLRRDAEASAFLGNLPPRAQSFLLAPFTDPADQVACRYYYEDESTVTAARLGVWCCLIGLRAVTFAAGTRVQERGRRAVSTWRVLCRRAGISG
jgi:hypothetical protein